MSSTHSTLNPHFLVLSGDVLNTAKYPQYARRNQLVLEHYGALLQSVPGVRKTRVTMATLREQLDHDIYGIVGVVPHYPWVVGTLHFQVQQQGTDFTTFTPMMVAVHTLAVSDRQVQESLRRLLYYRLRDHLRNRWFHGLSPLGYPSLALRFRPLRSESEPHRLVVDGSTHCCLRTLDYTMLMPPQEVHPKEQLLPVRRPIRSR